MVVATAFPLFVHVLGAMLLVGGIATALIFLAGSWRRDDSVRAAQLGRFGFRTLLFVAFPAWWVMRLGAQWIYHAQGWDDVADEPAWIGIGFATGEFGGILLLFAIVLAGLGARRLARPNGSSNMLLRVATVLVAIVLLAYVVATWAMSAKPG